VKINAIHFERAAYGPEDAPKAKGPDVIFVGRSNVGKSSLINRLVGQKGLARASATPGRTRSVNFFRVNESFHFVDLPGYGYAKISEEIRRSWKPLVESVLERRLSRIALALLVVDARHAPSELDRTMESWLVGKSIPYVVAATKADKLSAGARAQAARTLREGLRGQDGDPEVVLVSARTGLGMRELWGHLEHALGRSTAGARGEAWISGS
jgi:GTP-binding protein